MCLLIDAVLVVALVLAVIYLLGLFGIIPAIPLTLGSLIHLAIPIIVGLIVFWVLCRICGMGSRCCRRR